MPFKPRGIGGNVDPPPALCQRLGATPEPYHERWKRRPDCLGKEVNLHDHAGIEAERSKRVTVVPGTLFWRNAIDKVIPGANEIGRLT